jgi:hypothetical protein
MPKPLTNEMHTNKGQHTRCALGIARFVWRKIHSIKPVGQTAAKIAWWEMTPTAEGLSGYVGARISAVAWMARLAIGGSTRSFGIFDLATTRIWP